MKKSLFLIFTICLISLTYAEPIRIACVGNSITSGSGNPKTDQSTYPAQLGILMGENYEVQNFGVSGRTLLKKGDYPLWNETAFPEALEYKPNIVTILLGTNDSKPQNWAFKDEFITDYVAMIDTFRALDSNPEIWTCLPPPAFAIQWGIRDSIITADIIPMIKQIAAEKNTKMIDFYTAFEDKHDLFPDDIHPNVEGCWEFAQIIHHAITGDSVQAAKDVNLAFKKTVISPEGQPAADALVDGSPVTGWSCPNEESVVIDLGAVVSTDMFQIIFKEDGNFQYKIETSADNTNWNLAVNQWEQTEELVIAVDSIGVTDAQFVRFTFRNAGTAQSMTAIAELRIMQAAAIHAPAISYTLTRFSETKVYTKVRIRPSLTGGYLKYYTASGPDDAFTTSQYYKIVDEGYDRNVSFPVDEQRFIYAAFFKDGYEVLSDTIALDFNITKVTDKPGQLADAFRLSQNYPNPFNPVTEIRYEIPKSSQVQLVIYDCLGREVRTLVNKAQAAGEHTVEFHSHNLASGVYFYSLQAEGMKICRKMVLMR